MDIITTLRTLKGTPLQGQVQTLQSILNTEPMFERQVRSYIEKELDFSAFTFKDSVSDKYLATVALLSILLADIATIPDRGAREIYMKSFRELCQKYEVEAVDIEFLAKYTSGFENILENLG